jgi:hypothetical protein
LIVMPAAAAVSLTPWAVASSFIFTPFWFFRVATPTPPPAAAPAPAAA